MYFARYIAKDSLFWFYVHILLKDAAAVVGSLSLKGNVYR